MTVVAAETRIDSAAAASALIDVVAQAESGAITRSDALMSVTAAHLEAILHTQFDGGGEVIATGVPASPGAAVGRVYFTSDDALDADDRGEDVILVRSETTPADVMGMQVSQGLVTTRGGLASHAALVARGWGTPAIVGAEALVIGDSWFTVGDITVNRGDIISMDGATGEIVLGELLTSTGEHPEAFDTLLDWADEVRAGKLGVRANADTAEDAAVARSLGAEGIGLCRTEHMFLAPERLSVVREMILADTPEREAAALDRLGAAQQSDFETVLAAMDGAPVTVRLLDPPLHEFLPSLTELRIAAATTGLDAEQNAQLEAAETWAEHNPMIGTRGVRLGVIKPGLYAMQVRALLDAAAVRRADGGNPIVEIMIPLTVTREELALARSWVQTELDKSAVPDGSITIGTMIETPRAALCASELALEADFFSFGTNDLTQLTFGFSRDDVESRMMPAYLAQGLLAGNPFESIDQAGVGRLVEVGSWHGREARPGLKLGVCGEHGGDPESIDFFYRCGIDYVSCSPYRVPIARLAAAQAVIRNS